MVSLTTTAFPLGVVAMVVSLNPNIPRLFIERSLGAHALGFYAAAAYLLVAGRTVMLALGQSATPRLARHFAAGQLDSYRRLLGKMICVGIGFGVAGICVAATAGEWLLGIVYTPEYSAYNDVFLWLMVSAGLSYVGSFLWYGIVAARRFAVQIPLFLLVALASGLGAWLLVPRYGLRGAALAMVLAMLVQIVGSIGVLGSIWAAGTAPSDPEPVTAGLAPQ
jgi:O-antigen/teichoic acid export membrane protein